MLNPKNCLQLVSHLPCSELHAAHTELMSKDYQLKDVEGLQEAAYGMVGDDLSRLNAERRYLVAFLQHTHV